MTNDHMDSDYSDSDSDSFVVEGQDESFSEEPSSDDDDDENERNWSAALQRIKDNDPAYKWFSGGMDSVRDITVEGWEELGGAIANNTHLELINLCNEEINDHEMSFLFRGLTRSSSLKQLYLPDNGLSAAGVRIMVPFLQNADSLQMMDLDMNVNIQSEGFNMLLRALCDSPIEHLSCCNCGIESIKIDSEHFPKYLTTLVLNGNDINITADGCRELAKLLRGGDATLKGLYLDDNKIDDEGVEILVDALQNNTSLTGLYLRGNDGISNQGEIMLLKLVNDVSSIKATLQSNHTLTELKVLEEEDEDDILQLIINTATEINREGHCNGEAIGREKVIQTQLYSERRVQLYRLQEVNHSIYSEIDPLHLPEVLSVIDRRHGQGELYLALSSSIMALFSTVNMKKCIQQERDYHAAKAAEHVAKVEELEDKLALMEEEEVAARSVGDDNINDRSNKIESDESRSNKRRRTWWWGFWGTA